MQEGEGPLALAEHWGFNLIKFPFNLNLKYSSTDSGVHTYT